MTESKLTRHVEIYHQVNYNSNHCKKKSFLKLIFLHRSQKKNYLGDDEIERWGLRDIDDRRYEIHNYLIKLIKIPQGIKLFGHF